MLRIEVKFKRALLLLPLLLQIGFVLSVSMASRLVKILSVTGCCPGDTLSTPISSASPRPLSSSCLQHHGDVTRLIPPKFLSCFVFKTMYCGFTAGVLWFFFLTLSCMWFLFYLLAMGLLLIQWNITTQDEQQAQIQSISDFPSSCVCRQAIKLAAQHTQFPFSVLLFFVNKYE